MSMLHRREPASMSRTRRAAAVLPLDALASYALLTLMVARLATRVAWGTIPRIKRRA